MAGVSNADERFIKVYGERNTGTNYLDRLLASNLQATLLNGKEPKWTVRIRKWLRKSEWPVDLWFRATYSTHLGWKHGAVALPDPLPAHLQGRLTVVTLTKNPYSWILSLWKQPYHNKKATRALPSIEEFVRTPWPVLGRDMVNVQFQSPVDIWNAKVGSYLRTPATVPAVHMRYEDLLADPHRMVELVAQAGKIPVTEEFSNVSESTKRAEKGEMQFNDYQDYYLNERWREKLSAELVTEINKRLDKDLARHFGYEIL